MNLNAFRNEALAAFLATAAKDVTTIAGRHASAETELLFAGPLGRLIGAFRHKFLGAEVEGQNGSEELSLI